MKKLLAASLSLSAALNANDSVQVRIVERLNQSLDAGRSIHCIGHWYCKATSDISNVIELGLLLPDGRTIKVECTKCKEPLDTDVVAEFGTEKVKLKWHAVGSKGWVSETYKIKGQE